MKYRFLSIIFLLSIGFCSFANKQIRAGLFFSSHETIKDKRTSLHLTADKVFSFRNGFSMEFDAQFRQGDGYYGFISRIIADGNTNIDLISNLGENTSNFWLVVKDKMLFSFNFDEIPDFAFGKWIKIRLEIAPDSIALSFNGVRKSKNIDEIGDFDKFDIVFGACDNPKFLNTDVSPMTLNDIAIKENGKIFRRWKLSKHVVNAVYDEVKNTRASVKNGTWLIDKHIRWEEKDVQMSDLKGIATNGKDGIVYLIGKDCILAYHIADDKTETIRYKSGFPFNNYYDCFIYNPQTRKIISYDLTVKQFNNFDFDAQTWQYADFAYKEPDFAHHNKVLSPIDGSLITFGGYGHYKYKSVMGRNGELEDISGKIYPRYLSAAGIAGNEWLIFGGYGSKSGRQEISPEFFYDLYSYNFKTCEIKKLCDFPAPVAPFVPCETLLKNEKSFYTLIYNNTNFKSWLRLAEFFPDSANSTYTVFPDSIPYNFSDIGSWAILFLNEKTAQLVVVTNYKSDVKIYTLAYPPLSTADVLQTPPEKTAGKYAVIIVGVLLLIGIFFLRKHFKKETKSVEKNAIPEPKQEKTEEEVLLPYFEIPKRKSKSSIYFLGGFQVFDREGNDISSLFSPTIKQLFIIILLYMVKNGRGIPTAKLNETLWFDKTDSSARNNRNVTISKLRNLLVKVGEMDIVQESAYWRVQMEGVYSDYIEVMSICERLKGKNAVITETEAIRFVQIVSQGEMLPNLQPDWIDDFKADFSNIVIDTLLKIASLPDIAPNNQLIIHIADAIFKYDSINEDAIALKSPALCRLGKKGLAKMVYESFAKEYKALLGTAFNVPFNELVTNI